MINTLFSYVGVVLFVVGASTLFFAILSMVGSVLFECTPSQKGFSRLVKTIGYGIWLTLGGIVLMIAL